jgi:hypothetical protein
MEDDVEMKEALAIAAAAARGERPSFEKVYTSRRESEWGSTEYSFEDKWRLENARHPEFAGWFWFNQFVKLAAQSHRK